MNSLAVGFLSGNNPVQSAMKKNDAKPKIGEFHFKDAIHQEKEKLQNPDKSIKDRQSELQAEPEAEPKQVDQAETTKEKTEVEPIDANQEELKESLKLLEGAEDQMIQLLAQFLQVDVETVEKQLQQLGIEPMQLVEPIVFSQFIKSVLGDDLVALLGEKNQAKDISKLFDSLVAVKESVEQLIPEGLLPLLQKGKVEETADQTEQIVDMPQAKEKEALDNPVKNQIPQLTEVAVQGKEKKTDLKGEAEVLKSEGVTPKGSLADTLTLPVQNVLEAQSIKMWQQQTRETLGVMHTNHAPITKQIMDQVDFAMLKDGKEMTLDLAPKELGKLSIKISEHNGIVTTTIRVENEKTKEMLIQNLNMLKENLEAQGLKIGDFRVDVRHNDRQETMYKERQKSSKRIQEIISSHLEGDDTGEIENTNVSDGIHGEVDYMA